MQRQTHQTRTKKSHPRRNTRCQEKLKRYSNRRQIKQKSWNIYMKVSTVLNIAIRWHSISRCCLKRWREARLRGKTKENNSSGLQRLKGIIINLTADVNAMLVIKLLKTIGNPNQIIVWLKASELYKRSFLNVPICDFSFKGIPSRKSPIKSNPTFVPHRLSSAQRLKKLILLGAQSTPTTVGLIQGKWTPPIKCRCPMILTQMR